MIKEFRGSDSEYIDWIRKHPAGFVLNADAPPSTRVHKIHEAACRLISDARNGTAGGFTERRYMKVWASTAEELTDWAKMEPRGKVPGRCTRCGSGSP
jgi:5-methylcytosine-specific restriction enzyme A